MLIVPLIKIVVVVVVVVVISALTDGLKKNARHVGLRKKKVDGHFMSMAQHCPSTWWTVPCRPWALV